METFFAVIGVIAVIIFVVIFIAAPVQNRTPQMNDTIKQQSLKMLCTSFGCREMQAREHYLEGIEVHYLLNEDIVQLLQHLKQRGIEEGISRNIHPNDTAAKWMEFWLASYYRIERKNGLVN